MSKIKIVVGLILFGLFSLVLLADGETKKQGKNMNQSVLTDKPSFKVKIEGSNAQFIVYLNGIAIYNHFSLRSVSLEYPVNDFITTGENKLEVFVFSEYNAKKLNTNANCKATLVVRKFESFDDPVEEVLTLSYDHAKKNKLEGTTEMGRYSSIDGFKKSHKQSDVTVEKATISSFEPVELLPSTGAIAHMDFSLPTPFPRWKFLDAPSNILDKPYYGITIKEFRSYQKDHPTLNKLYNINYQMYNAAKSKDVEQLLSFFSERNAEADIAFYRKKGETEQELRASLTKAMEDTSQALIGTRGEEIINDKTWKEDPFTFFVERSNSLAYITNILCWNSIDYPGSSCFKMKFRYDGNRWILTR